MLELRADGASFTRACGGHQVLILMQEEHHQKSNYKRLQKHLEQATAPRQYLPQEYPKSRLRHTFNLY